MKAVILAGGLGTRISEESHLKPKPMIEIGGKPILWHIMKQYSAHGIHDFVICLGYKGYAIKDFFANYFLHTSDVTFDMCNNRMDVHQNYSEPWRVTLVETGEDTMTGGRLRRASRYLDGEQAFCFTYGDGVSDLNIGALVDFHLDEGETGTQLMAWLRTRLGEPVPGVVISADGRPELIAQVHAAGLDFLAKPVKPAAKKKSNPGSGSRQEARQEVKNEVKHKPKHTQ